MMLLTGNPRKPPDPIGRSPSVRRAWSLVDRSLDQVIKCEDGGGVPFTAGRPVTEAKAELFKVLGHPVRVRVLELLAEREQTMGELADAAGVEPSHLSQHVALLHRAGVVDRRRVRTSVVCSLRDPQIAELLAVARSVLSSHLRHDQELLSALEDADDAVTAAGRAGA
jgi:DNA-binding transcriptional ArsR family regulator